MFRDKFLTALFSLSVLASQPVWSAEEAPLPAPLPVSAFASLPDVSYVEMSPDGQRVSSMVRVDGENPGVAVLVYDVKTGQQKTVAYAENVKFVIEDATWANNDQLLLTAKFASFRGRTATNEWRTLVVNADTAESRPLVGNRLLKKLKFAPNVQSNVIDLLPHDDNKVLLEMAGYSREGETNVFELEIGEKQRFKMVQKHRHNVFDWMSDVQGNVRIAYYRNDTQYRIMERKNKKDKLRVLWEFDVFGADAVWPLGFDVDPNILYVSALHEGRDAVFTVDLSDPELKKTLVYSDDFYDVGGSLRRAGRGGKVIGIGNNFWDKDIAKLMRSIDKVLPEKYNRIISLSDDMRRYVVLSSNDTDSGVYIYGDRDEHSMTPIAYRYSKLSPERMSEKKVISYNARDGLEIEGFLTLPKGEKQENLPTLIFPHGGPISFDGDGFDYWTQFFASRGYAVLQMNFRGSSGYGHDFMKQGLDSWGQAMQDDVTDGTRWLIEQGVADPNRICIVGASYGGYAALMGTVKEPDLYKCAASFGGVMDVEYLVKSKRNFTNYEIVKKQIGSDWDELEKRSPVNYADKVKVPVLLLHGRDDRVVRYKHSKRMYQALKDEGKNVAYIELDKGDHYLSNNAHRLQVFEELEAFFAKHL